MMMTIIIKKLLTTVKTFLRSLCREDTSTPRPASPSLLSVSARGPDNALNCCQDLAYCRRTNSMIVEVRASPIRMYKVHSSMYFGLSVKLCADQYNEHALSSEEILFYSLIENDRMKAWIFVILTWTINTPSGYYLIFLAFISNIFRALVHYNTKEFTYPAVLTIWCGVPYILCTKVIPYTQCIEK